MSANGVFISAGNGSAGAASVVVTDDEAFEETEDGEDAVNGNEEIEGSEGIVGLVVLGPEVVGGLTSDGPEGTMDFAVGFEAFVETEDEADAVNGGVVSEVTGSETEGSDKLIHAPDLQT